MMVVLFHQTGMGIRTRHGKGGRNDCALGAGMGGKSLSLSVEQT